MRSLDLLQQPALGVDVEPWARGVDRRPSGAGGPGVLRVELRKTDGKLGVGLGGGNDMQPLCVQSLAPGSAAAADGRLRVGDRILKIDGFHVDRASYEGAVALLRTTDDVVVFEVARDDSRLDDLPDTGCDVRSW